MKDQGTRVSFEAEEVLKGTKTATKRAHLDSTFIFDKKGVNVRRDNLNDSPHNLPSVTASSLPQQTQVDGEKKSVTIDEHLVRDFDTIEEGYMLTSLTALLKAQHRYARRLSHHGGVDDPLICPVVEDRHMS